jgi:hypothetical protein
MVLFPFLVALAFCYAGDELARGAGGLSDPDAALPGE